MNRLLKLKPYIGLEKTLVLCCSEFSVQKFVGAHDNIFVHTVPGGRLLRYDREQRTLLQHHIDGKSCSQLIFIGSMDTKLFDRLYTDDSLLLLRSALKFNLKGQSNDQFQNIISPAVERQMLIEMNVVNQCNLLLDYFFVKEKVEKNKLQVKGVVTDINSEHLKLIFRNGIVYNDLLTLN